jgi:hypothetical protein
MKMAGGLCSRLSGREVDRGSSTGHKVPFSTASDSVGPAAKNSVKELHETLDKKADKLKKLVPYKGFVNDNQDSIYFHFYELCS